MCSECNHCHSRATQCTSPLASRSANDDSVSKQQPLPGNSFNFFFSFFFFSIVQIELRFWSRRIIRRSSCIQVNESSRTWALVCVLSATVVAVVQRSAPLHQYIESPTTIATTRGEFSFFRSCTRPLKHITSDQIYKI